MALPNDPLGDERSAETITRPVHLRDIVADRIREMVISGKAPGGKHLVETEIGAILGVSRQPIREAFVALRSEGWLELVPGKGTFVRRPTLEEVTGLFTVRMALEGEAALCAASVIQIDGVEALKQICRDGRTALELHDRDRIVLANAKFHTTVAQLAAIPALNTVIRDMDSKVRWYYASIADYRGEQSWNEHDAIVDALASGNRELAWELSRKHIEESRDMYIAHLSSKPPTSNDEMG